MGEALNYTANGLVKSDYTFLMRWLAALADEAVIALGQRSVSTTSGKLMQKALQFIYGRPEALKGAEPEQKEAAM